MSSIVRDLDKALLFDCQTGSGAVHYVERCEWLIIAGLSLVAACTAPNVTSRLPNVVATIGDEQTIAEQYASKWDRPDPQRYNNVLDYVHTVLAQRAVPSPNAAALMRCVVSAMAAVASQASNASANELTSRWLAQAVSSASFSVVLEDPVWLDVETRRRGIDAGLRAMLGESGWLLAPEQAKEIRQMIAARQANVGESPAPPTPFTLKRLRPHIVYVKIPTFEDADIGWRVANALRTEIDNSVEAVLLDLRDNPGGRAEQANAVADVFLDRRPLQIMRFANGQLVTIVSRPGASKATVVVLVNRHTGSSAEMLAMALRDNDRGILVGEQTAGALFGKDSVNLPDGRMVMFRCEPTVLSPTATDYAVSGIPPDKTVVEANPAKADLVVRAALEAISTNNEPSWPARNKGGKQSSP